MTLSVPESEYRPLRVRVLAADDGIARVKRFDPVTGEPHLVHAVTGEPLDYPVAGVHFSDLEGNEIDPPYHLRFNHGTDLRYDWIELEEPTAVHRPGGTAETPWSTTHTFIHATAIVLHLTNGPRRYVVVRQPDKYDSTGMPGAAAGDALAHIFWDYLADWDGA